LKPWNASNTEGRITRPLRHNGTPYRGINVLLLWGEAMDKGYASSIWMTYRQAVELNAQVRKGEHGALVVYADRFTTIEAGDQGEDVEREIPFMKGYYGERARYGLAGTFWISDLVREEKSYFLANALIANVGDQCGLPTYPQKYPQKVWISPSL
jgi:hypothetical protein